MCDFLRRALDGGVGALQGVSGIAGAAARGIPANGGSGAPNRQRCSSGTEPPKRPERVSTHDGPACNHADYPTEQPPIESMKPVGYTQLAVA
ncbi:hypothetical protein D3C75_1038230 [compost metagenome]